MAYDKVVDSSVLDGYFDNIADAIRAKGGSGTYTPAQMPQAIEDLPASDPNLMALLAGTATGEVTVKNVEHLDMISINLGLSDNLNPITELHLPDTLSLCAGNVNYAQYDGLYDLNNGNAKLQILDIPKCTRLYIHNARRSTSYDSFKNLTTLNAPQLKSLWGHLRGCGLEYLDLPELFEMSSSNIFQDATNLKEVRIPRYGADAYNYISGRPFVGCTSLELADLGSPYGIMDAFNSTATSLKALVIRRPLTLGKCSLSSASDLTNSPIASGTGYIYVPRDAISSYESATNWSTYAGQFRALEDYTDDHTVDGEFILPAN